MNRQSKTIGETKWDEFNLDFGDRELNTITNAYLHQLCLILEKKSDDWLEKVYRKLSKDKVRV